MGLVRLVHALKIQEVVLSRFAIKSSLAGGIVYYTIQEGLWSRPEESVKLYGKIYNTVAPYVKENIPKGVAQELSELPSTRDISTFVKTSWNKGVMISAKFLTQAPCCASKSIDSLAESVQKYLKDMS